MPRTARRRSPARRRSRSRLWLILAERLLLYLMISGSDSTATKTKSNKTGVEVEGGLLTGVEEAHQEEDTRVAGGILCQLDDDCDCDGTGEGGLQAPEGGRHQEGGAGRGGRDRTDSLAK